MKLLCQLINHKDGQRSGVLEMTRDQLSEQLQYSNFIHRHDELKLDQINADYVLILMEKPDGQNEEYQFSIAPIMTVDQFIEVTSTSDQRLSNFCDWETLETLQQQEQYA